jgi:hypothetical protein
VPWHGHCGQQGPLPHPPQQNLRLCFFLKISAASFLRSQMRRPAALLFALVAAAAALAPTKPCLDTLNAQPFETVCHKTLANASGGLLTVRAYAGASAQAFSVTSAASGAVTVYQEALELTTFGVLDYFTNRSSTLSARTVPLTLRPPTPAHNEWVGQMALAPSKWPPGSKPPPPPYAPTRVAPLGDVTLAALRATMQSSPQPSDFDALCARLRAAVPKELPAWRVDEASPVSPTHARYFSQEWEGPWLVECWVGVVAA